jgi:hypothetical protein
MLTRIRICRQFRVSFLALCAVLLTQLTSCLATVSAQSLERWVYVPVNLLVPEQVARVETLMREAQGFGFTHILLTDSKFCRLHEMDRRYFDHVQKIRQLADELHLRLVPAVFPVGYSNDLLSQNVNLAEGLPVRNALFEIQGGKAELVPDPQIALPSFENRAEWNFVDDTFRSEGKTLIAENPAGRNCRAMKAVQVSPFRHYHVSVRVRTQKFRGQPQITVLEPETGRRLTHTNLKVTTTSEWSVQHITFNSLQNTSVNVYLGAWGAQGENLWLEDPAIEECGLLNVLRRDGTPLTVTTEGPGSKVLIEGEEFEPIQDPLLGMVPYAGEYDVWHNSPSIKMKGSWPDGTRLRVSWYHPHIIHDGQVCGCATEPEFAQLLQQQAAAVENIFPATDRMMSHDEWRLMGWEESFRRSGKTPAQVAADNVRMCVGHLRSLSPDRRIMVWSDMFDPHHNAVDNYYLVNGDLSGSWKGLDPRVVIMNWNFGLREESLKFFVERGHSQILAGYYDADAEQIGKWLETVKKQNVRNVIGVMYTTWHQDYSQLNEFAKVVDRFDIQE